MNRKGAAPTKSGPLSDEEIIDSFKRSGFPFELRLMKAFSDGGMDPVLGFRVAPAGSTETRELDLLASFSRSVVVGQKVLTVSLRLVVEAKSLPSDVAFVGLPWERPPDLELRVGRAYFGGRPSNRVLSDLERDGHAIVGASGLAEAFDPLNAAPVCVQWAIAKRLAGKDTVASANHDGPFWEWIDGVVRAAHSLNFSFSEFAVTSNHLRLQFELPVLMLATDQLRVLDVSLDPWTVSTTQRLILARTFQVHNHIEHRLVDVVTENGVPSFIEACRATVDKLKKLSADHAPTLIELASRQREQYQMALLQRAP
jgi:hypothetical protein